MRKTTFLSYWRWRSLGGALLLSILALGARNPAAAADELFIGQADFNRVPLLPSDLKLDMPPVETGSTNKAQRIRLFGITPAFLNDPVDLDQDDSPLADPRANNSPWPTFWNAPDQKAGPSGGPDWVNVSLGNHNPFFDLRQPGDPGGVGYFQLATQFLLLDSSTTTCALAFQAYAPAGQEAFGVSDGPRVLSPAFSVFHDLGDGTAIQGFVGKYMVIDPRQLQLGTNQLQQNVHYGVALQRPLLAPDPDGSGNVYVFVETLGRYHYGILSSSTTSTTALELLPGFQWRMNETTWLSSGVVLPVGTTSHYENNHLQFTCSFQF